MKTIKFLFAMLFMLVASSQAQFSGTVELKSGKRMQGYILPQHGKLLVLSGQDTLRLERSEISQVWRGLQASDNVVFSMRVNLFAGWMPIMPGQLRSGMIGFNFGVKEIQPVNIGLFYQAGSGSKSKAIYVQNGFLINRAISHNEMDGRSYGFIYEINRGQEQTFVMLGETKVSQRAYIEQNGKKIRNSADDKRKNKFMFSILHSKGRIFFQVGSTFDADAIAGVGIKI